MGLLDEMLRTSMKPSAIATDMAWPPSTVKKKTCPRHVTDPRMKWCEHDQLKLEKYMDDISTKSLGYCVQGCHLQCFEDHAVQAHFRARTCRCAPMC